MSQRFLLLILSLSLNLRVNFLKSTVREYIGVVINENRFVEMCCKSSNAEERFWKMLRKDVEKKEKDEHNNIIPRQFSIKVMIKNNKIKDARTKESLKRNLFFMLCLRRNVN